MHKETIDDIRIGFIGAGVLATTMIKAIIKSELTNSQNIFVSDLDNDKLLALEMKTGINTQNSNREVLENSEIVFLTIKPNIYSGVLEEVAPFLSPNHILISVAAGLSSSFIKEKISYRCKVLRTMPNIASMVEEGMTAICTNHGLSHQELESIKLILSTFGKIEEVKEELMNAVTAISGSSPAFVFMFIEALADGGVLMGIPRDQAYRFVLQAIMGSCKMIEMTTTHPAFFKDMVCTPGGTTIQGIQTLENGGFRGIVINAIKDTTLRAREIQNENC